MRTLAPRTLARAVALAVSLCGASALAAPALAAPHELRDAQMNQVVAGSNFNIIGGLNFNVISEVADTASAGATTTDPLLVNSWGLSQGGPGAPLWVANNGTGTSTLYSPTNWSKVPLNVTIPGAGGAQGTPTGTVFTSPQGNTFQVTQNGVSGHSLFLFDAEDGTISGWSPGVSLNNAVIAVDQSAAGAVFKGLAISPSNGNPTLFAANFGNNDVEMFNGKFQSLGSFTDPSLPAGFAPFNVQVLNGKVYVAFAQHGEGHDEAHGAGLGFIDEFDLSGHKMRTLVSHGVLNAPWGMTMAPPSMGRFAGALLVGNFGDGKINAFNPDLGTFLGTVSSSAGTPITIDGLWALQSAPDGTVIFSSGPGDENHGLVGVIQPKFAKASWAFQSHVQMGR
jgi:uncharacterized protein (TIGR03118 family)